MNATDVITLIGAIATFLFGMSTMTDGLEKLSSGRLEGILERLTSNVFKGVLLGALVTGLIQSSAATTVMCVGFVNAGIMKLPQTVGIIMGANIGTTVTAQLLRLGDISSDNVFLALLKPSILGPLLAAVGIVLFMFLKGSSRRQIVGQILLGLGLLFIGMKTMENAVSGLQELPAFRELFVAFSNPLLGILVGAAVTALIQSSSASMGILQAVSSTGVVSFHIAIPLIMGQNIGTCITALLSAIGASKNAKRTAMVHLLFNIIGTLFFLVVLYAGNALFHFPFWGDVMNRGSIANLHLGFNVACTLLLPFNRVLVKIVETLVPGDTGTIDINPLDERFLSSPAVALEHARAAVINMGTMARDNYRLAVELLSDYDDKKLERLHETESAIDKLENMLDSYLVKLTDRALTQSESNLVSELLHTLTNFERIGDYSVNLSESATALHSRDIAFSPVASRELRYLTDAVGKAVDTTLACYAGRDHALSMQVEPLEEVVDLMEDTLKNRHIERLKSGACTIELGTQFLELLINLERISDHCSNVAMLILRSTTPAKENLPDNHTYLKYLHSGASAEFEKLFAQYQEQYYAPIRKEA